jgi:anti-sigma factor RsiW
VTACEDLRHELGAFVLGALPPEEEASVREHLARCTECRHEHGRLAGLPGLLDLAEAAPERPAFEQPSPLLEDAVLEGFRGGQSPARPPRRRRRLALPAWRVALPSAVVGALLAVAVLALTGTLSDDGAAPASTSVQLRGDTGFARAVIAGAEPGTIIELDANLPPSGRNEHYDVFMMAGDYEISAGTFRVGADGHVKVELACGGPPEVYDRIEIRKGDADVLTAQLPA